MSGEKDQPATEHKRREARRKGQVATSVEANSAAAMAAVLAYLLVMAEDMALRLHRLFHVALGEVGRAREDRLASIAEVGLLVAADLAWLCLPPLLVAAAAALAMGVVQTRGLFAVSQVQPQIDRVNPVNGFKQVFSLRTLLNFVRLLFGLALITAVVVVTYRDMLPDMLRAGHLRPLAAVAATWDFVCRLLLAGLLVAVLMALADYAIKLFDHARNLRMSKQEVKQEHKDIEGDPLVKATRRGFFEELIDSATQKAVEDAEVMVVNPTHVAIAIHYKPGKIDLPMVAAKGLDEVALAMRRLAERHGVPIYEDRGLARELYRECRKREYITHRHFEAVSEVFRWLAKIKGAKDHAARVAARQRGAATP